MNRLAERFAALKASGEKALIAYVVAGDPSLKRTVEIVAALDAAGVDAVELGIPFSDPLADGPVIQAAAHRALESGASVAGCLECLRQVRRRSQVPVILMTYYNPVLRYGVERFAIDAAAAGADAAILTDLTPEESDPWRAAAAESGLETVFLVAPTSTRARIRVVARNTTGFVYCVSRTGVTGARSEVPAELGEFVRRVRSGIAAGPRPDLPVCVGFGISRPEHVAAVAAVADGAVVGSALVKLIAQYDQDPVLELRVTDFARGLKAATRPHPESADAAL